MTTQEASEELDRIYIRIGNGEELTDERLRRINELEGIVNPPREEYKIETVGCGCGHPAQCWDCAAIIGGCPEDV